MNKNTMYGLLAGAVIVLSISTYWLTNKQSTDQWSVWTTSFTTQSVNSFDCATANTEIPVSECEALVALYYSTDGDNRHNNTNWLDMTKPASSWYGVTVKNSNVTSLLLYNNQLSWPIPAALENLTKLNILHLSNNKLSGSIPWQLGQLTDLQELVLYDNELSESIPHELSQLNNLKILDLSYNQLSGPIPVAFGNLINLERLWIDNNQVSGPIPTELGKLINLKSLNFSRNQLSGQIPSKLGNLTQLELAFLHYNQLSGPIPTELSKLIKLKNLRLNSNKLCGSIPINFMLNGNWNATTQPNRLMIQNNNLLDNQSYYSVEMREWLKYKGFITFNVITFQTPSSCEEKTCGDGIVDPGEQCDGIGQAQCQSGYICNAPSAKFPCQCSAIKIEDKHTDKTISSDTWNWNVWWDTTDRWSRDNNNPPREAR
jgi:hypothetical protein